MPWLALERTLEALRGVPGLVLLDAARTSRGYRIEGLRDPLAELPPLAEELDGPLTFAWRPFVSLEPAIVRARAQTALAPPAGVAIDLRGEVLSLSGAAPVGWLRSLAAHPPAIPGVARLETAALEPSAEREIAAVDAVVVNFPSGEIALPAESVRALRSAAGELLALSDVVAPFGWEPAVRVSGSADRRGEWDRNLELANERASVVASVLEQAGVPSTWIQREAGVSPSDTDVARRTALAVRLVRRETAGAAP